MSPEARVEEGAIIEAPCFIDEGVVVKAGARVGAYARVALERSALISVWTSEAKHLSSTRRPPMSRRLRAWSNEWTDELRKVRTELGADQARILVAGAIGLISTTATSELNDDGHLEDRITSMAMATLAAPIN